MYYINHIYKDKLRKNGELPYVLPCPAEMLIKADESIIFINEKIARGYSIYPRIKNWAASRPFRYKH